jgi:hypothetical protein
MSLPRRVAQLPCRVGDGRSYSEQNNADRILDSSRSEDCREGTDRKELSVGERVLDEVEIVSSVNPFKLTRGSRVSVAFAKTRSDFKDVVNNMTFWL